LLYADRDECLHIRHSPEVHMQKSPIVLYRDEEFKTPSGSGGHYQPHGNCVAVAINRDGVFVRNSNDARKTTVTFTHEEWKTFVQGVKQDEFNVPSFNVARDGQVHGWRGPTSCACGATIPETDNFCPVGNVPLS
jgi:hypothetical protein